jgi:MFS family permease
VTPSSTSRLTPAQRWVLVLSSLASLMVALDALVVSTALGTIHRQLGASIDQLEWTVNAYGLSFAVLLIPAAALGDRWGRRRLFAAGLGLFAVGSAACALAPDAGLLIAASPIGTLIQNTHCQASPWVTAPPITGPLSTARPVIPL